MKTTRLFIEVLKYSARGAVYRIRLSQADGPILLYRTLQPLFDSARALLRRGISGRVDMWDAEKSFPRISGDIVQLAKLTIEENSTVALRLRLWKEFDVGTGKPKDTENAVDERTQAQSQSQESHGAVP